MEFLLRADLMTRRPDGDVVFTSLSCSDPG